MTAAVSPAVDADLSVVEMPVPHVPDEARAAMAAVGALLDSGVSTRDVLIVASDLDVYEPALARAAIREGLTPTFWTQLDLADTHLYRVLDATCTLLNADRLAARDLQTVLAMGGCRRNQIQRTGRWLPRPWRRPSRASRPRRSTPEKGGASASRPRGAMDVSGPCSTGSTVITIPGRRPSRRSTRSGRRHSFTG